MKKIEVLDCTLRDGGYVNNWEFGKNNIKRVINKLTESDIDIIECGFLNQKKAYKSDKSIFDSIDRFKDFIPKNKNNKKYVCMINFGTYDIEDIPEYDGTSVDGIRVAFHKKDVNEAIEYCRKLSKKGYMLFIQIMVTINYSDMELLHVIKEFNEIKPYAFYMVDSFGMMKQKDLLRMFYLIDNNLNKNINTGYHSHNNMQLSYSNAQALVELNTNRTIVIDSSVFGMGRGAGNLNTELFLGYLNEFHKTKYKIYPLLEIIDEVLNNIYFNKYWGYSLPHYLSAANNCHPNYATFLADKNTLTVKSISTILEKLPQSKKGNFNKDYAEKLYLEYQKHNINDIEIIEKLKSKFKGKEVMIIAPGSSLNKYKEKIKEINNRSNIKTICVNFIPKDFNYDYVFVSNEKRFKNILEKNNLEKEKIIITSNIKKDFLKVNYIDLLNNIDYVKDNSSLMLLNLLKKTNVNKVYLAGLDGYHQVETDYFDKNMNLVTSKEAINKMNLGMTKILKKLNLNIEFVTPSIYQNIEV
ncbi:MAG: aldolase catalytic domain-containing protein [Nanobdellota archaeon]